MPWPRKHYTKLLVLAIVLAGLIVRFWNFPTWYGFDYDQEVNAWIAKSIVVDHKPVLIGPETSVGGMYVGPYFNYVIAAFFALGKMDPMTTILLNILLAATTMWIFYLIGKKLFGQKAAIIGLIFYTFSYMIGSYDQVLWNPTPIPLVSLLFFYFLYRNRIILAAFFLGIMFHLHFQAILLVVIFSIYLLIFNRKAIFNPKNILGIFIVIVIFFAPLVLFDLRHNFLNFNHLIKFIFGNSDTNRSLDFYNIWQIINVLISFFRDLIYSGGYEIVRFLTLILPIGTFIHLIKNRKHNFYKVFLIALSVTFITFVFYKGPLPPPYYFLFLYPLFLLSLSDWLSKQRTFLIAPLLIAFLIWNPVQLLNVPNDLSLQNKHSAVKYITQKVDDKTFKVDMITGPGLNTGYRYLFWLEYKNPAFNHTVQTEKSFKMVIPLTIARKEELSATFGSIGIVELP